MRPALDLKHALRVYVLGHDAGYDVATKLRIAAGELETERLAAGAAGAAAALDPATSASDGERGVPVPEQLDFHRSAGTWRDHIPGLRRGV
jgi:hypothetical protein